jgi:hypothetical protein
LPHGPTTKVLVATRSRRLRNDLDLSHVGIDRDAQLPAQAQVAWIERLPVGATRVQGLQCLLRL